MSHVNAEVMGRFGDPDEYASGDRTTQPTKPKGITEHLFMSQEAAYRARKIAVDNGRSVSLVAYDPDRERYVFDSRS